jgi:hypothetical protein
VSSFQVRKIKRKKKGREGKRKEDESWIISFIQAVTLMRRKLD